MSKLLPKNNFQQLYSEFFEPSSATLMNQMFNIANIQQMDNILEIGTGTGYVFPYLIINKKPSASFTAIDISTQFLQASSQRLQYLEQLAYVSTQNTPEFQIPEEKLETFQYSSEKFNIHLKTMNAEKLEFQNESFDGYFASFVLHHSDWDKSISEAYRVLRPGGRIALGEFGPKGFQGFNQRIPEIESLLEKLYGNSFIEYRKNVDDFHKRINDHHHHHHHHHHNPQDDQKQHNHQHQNQHDQPQNQCQNNNNKNQENQQCDKNKENQENSNKVTKISTEFGEHRGIHNFFDMEQIKQKLEFYGFKNVLHYKHYLPILQSKDRCIQQYLNNGLETLKSDLSQEEQNSIKDQIYQILLRSNEDQNQPRGLDSHVIIGYK